MTINDLIGRLYSQVPSGRGRRKARENRLRREEEYSQALVDQAVHLYVRCCATPLAPDAVRQLAPLLLAPPLSRMALAAAALCREYGVPAQTLAYLYGRREDGQADVERSLVVLLETTSLLHGLLCRTVAGTAYYRGTLNRQAALGVWGALCSIASLFGLDPQSWLTGRGEGDAAQQAPSLAPVDILFAPDPTWAGAAALLCSGLPERGALLFVPASHPLGCEGGGGCWYALRDEAIQPALVPDLVVVSRDGWCRGFCFKDSGPLRSGLSLKEVCRQVSGGSACLV